VCVCVCAWCICVCVYTRVCVKVLGDERQYCLLPLHSSLPAHAMRAVFARARPGVRKIVLSTNIAETGVTLPDVVYVIDRCAARE
jgi:ATP-dependent RNA helicase DHX36